MNKAEANELLEEISIEIRAGDLNVAFTAWMQLDEWLRKGGAEPDWGGKNITRQEFDFLTGNTA